MTEATDQELLARYAREGDDGAFALLVKRQVDLVYSAARRIVVDPHLAEDVTQSVFVALATQADSVAGRLQGGAPLSGWLHLTTRNVAANSVRSEERRRGREQEAFRMQTWVDDGRGNGGDWARIEGHLDAALAELAEPDRDALLLRYFERRTAREIGTRLGIGEEAAQKRVARSLDRLRSVLVARGLAVPSATLAGALTAHAVQTAPLGLGAAIGGAVAAAVAAQSAASLPASGVFLMTTSKTTLVATLAAVAGLTTALVVQQRQLQSVREELANLRATPVPEATLPAAAPASGGAADSQPLDAAAQSELLRLRGEVAQLRRERAELQRRAGARPVAATGAGAVAAVDDAAAEAAAAAELERYRAMGIRKLNFSKTLGLAFILFAGDNGDQLPSSFEQAQKYLPKDFDTSELSLDHFEILYTGKVTDVANPSRAIILREKEGFTVPGKPGLSRTYQFADGHSEIAYREDGDFTSWEAERAVVSRAAAPK